MFLARLTIRWRITLGSLLIAALFFGVAALAFRSQVATILASTTETLLKHDAAPVRTEILDGAQKIDEPGKAQLVSVIDPTGTVRRSTLPDDLAARLPELLRLHGEPKNFTTKKDSYLVLAQTVETTGGPWRIVTARDLDASVLLLDRITDALVIGALVLVVGFGAASWLLTGAALRPVNRMRRQASELSRSSTALPLPVGPARDELSALATTLNEFIDQQRMTAARERRLVSDASHELRSPIAVLKAQLELAHLSSGDAWALEAEISAAEHSVARIAAIAADLLELSEVESMPTTASSSWSELSMELGSAVDRARLVGALPGTRVEFAIEPRGHDEDGLVRYPVTVGRFGRILDNLAGNSIAAMPEGGGLRLSLLQEPDRLTLRVVDSGPGLPESFLPIAFDRFSRPDPARANSTGGSGLGLAIVKAIVDDAQGTVALANRAEGGLEAVISIPELSEESGVLPE
ncbi:ATP-binding protein [Leifsonia bigeumensis]|uniref:histidine kinase n=1 Tax=Leifsonella bigeumensis TaxID=433643 RepID=A0ABP7FPA1_9MICO